MNPFKRTLGAIATCTLAIVLNTNQAHAADAPTFPLSESSLVKPVLDVPLRAPSICKGPDGMYYLTGTGAVKQPDGTLDFENCGGIQLWKSKDLKTWEALGEVYDPTKVGYTPDKGHSMRWTRNPRGLPGVSDSLRHYLGLTSPEIHYLKDTFWITFSTNGDGTVLIKSTTGKAEGPYEAMGKKGSAHYRITNSEAAPSLFQDDDGSVYWLWSPAWIAKMNDDMTGLAEAPRMLTCEPQKALKGDVMVGNSGPFLWKANGLYHLAVADVNHRNGIRTAPTMVATSKTLFGIYSKRIVMIPEGGETTVFQDDQGNYRATASADAAK